jgi:hypothetical protein
MYISIVKIHGIVIVFNNHNKLIKSTYEFKKKKSICSVILSPVGT